MKWAQRFRGDIYLKLTMLLSAFLNGYNIWTDKYANTYYTTAVASMLQSFHNFFFGSLDPAGSVTVDKPPVTFWIQTISAYIFGLHGWSVILPQAIAGVGSVLLVYLLVKPTFGIAAARIGALAMALTPILAAVSRTNNIDSMLVFTLLLATWLLFKGIRKSSVWSIIGAFAMIGVGFNMKMLQAYMVLPAFYLFYVMASNFNWKKKIAVLASATAVLAVVSLSWAVIVDAIPADKRPYIGSSQTNSVLELAFGYNGISRLTGDQGRGGGMQGNRENGMNFSGGQMPAGGQAGNGSGTTAASGSGQAGNGSGTTAASGSGQAGNGSGTTAASGSGQAGNGSGTAAASGTVQSANGGGAAADSGSGQSASANGQSAQGNGAAASGGTGQTPTSQNGGAMPNFGGGANGFPGGFEGTRGSGMSGMFGTGNPGPLRLFQSELSGQASWLIPFAAFGALALLAGWRRRNTTQQHKETLFWLAWLIPAMGFFSVAGFFHHYYLIMLAAPIAALVGAGWVKMWESYRGGTGILSWLLPAAILATAAFEWYIMHPNDQTIGSGWSIGVAAAGIVMTILLIAYKRRESMSYAFGVTGLLILLVGPLYWAATPITYGQNSMLPQAGPGTNRSIGGPPGMASGQDGPMAGGQLGSGMNAGQNGGAAAGTAGINRDRQDGGRGFGMGTESIDETTLAYLKEHNTGETYLFATFDYNTAASYIIDKGEKVITMGGFSGSDPVYSVAELEQLVKSGKVKYFMISGGSGGFGRGGSTELNQWITKHGTEIPTAQWKSTGSGSNTGFMGPGGSMKLYEVKL